MMITLRRGCLLSLALRCGGGGVFSLDRRFGGLTITQRIPRIRISAIIAVSTIIPAGKAEEVAALEWPTEACVKFKKVIETRVDKNNLFIIIEFCGEYLFDLFCLKRFNAQDSFFKSINNSEFGII